MIDKIHKELERIKKKLFFSGTAHRQIEKLQFEIDNIPYELYDKFNKSNLALPLPQIKTLDETLDKIINDGCSIARFGDGEFLCMNTRRIGFHDPSKELAVRLKEVLLSDHHNLLIGLADCFGSLDSYVTYTKIFCRKWLAQNRQTVYSFLDMNKTYYNAFFNRFYLNYNKTDAFYDECRQYVQKLKQIWANRDIVFIENKDSRLGIGNDLFDNSKSISRIICPARNAFFKYNQILSSCENIKSDMLILISLGPTATVLAYDLCNKGYQAIDIGQIDDEYNCFLRKEKPLELKSMGHDCHIKHDADANNPDCKHQIISIIQ